MDKGDLVRDDLLPSGKNTILDVSITRPLVDTAASKYEAKKDMDYDAVIGTKGVDFGVVLPGDFSDARRTVDRNPYRLPSLCRLAPLPLRCGCACCTGAHGVGATVLGLAVSVRCCLLSGHRSSLSSACIAAAVTGPIACHRPRRRHFSSLGLPPSLPSAATTAYRLTVCRRRQSGVTTWIVLLLLPRFVVRLRGCLQLGPW